MLIKNKVPTNQGDNINQTPLFYVSREGHLEIAKLLVENGADVNYSDKYR